MTFRQLMQHLESRLGHHQFPLDPAARDVRHLFESCALHHELALTLAREIFRCNKCQALDDGVARAVTFDAIAPVRLRILHSTRTDIDTFNFIEDACVAVSAFFGAEPADDVPAAVESGGKVVMFPALRARKVRFSV